MYCGFFFFFLFFRVWKKNIFFNYRGDDTGPIFVCHLHKALTEENFKVFDDSEIVRGEKILTSLFSPIKNAYALVVVFSKTYALSKWCLREVVKIMKRRKERGLIVLPVLHNIDTSHVRHQLGSFEEAFRKHSQNFDTGEVQKWSDALVEALKQHRERFIHQMSIEKSLFRRRIIAYNDHFT